MNKGIIYLTPFAFFIEFCNGNFFVISHEIPFFTRKKGRKQPLFPPNPIYAQSGEGREVKYIIPVNKVGGGS